MKLILVAFALLGACYASPATYIIKPGDTYYGISQKYGYDMKAIKDLNPGVDPTDLWEGMEIKVPGSGRDTPTIPTSNTGGSESNIYIIKEGDTLFDICEREGYNLKQVEAMNRNIDATQLQPGQELIVPGKGQGVSESLPSRSTIPRVRRDEDFGGW